MSKANFVVTGPACLGTGSAVYQLPRKVQSIDLGANFLNTLAANNVTVQYVDNNRLANGQKSNFAPRVGLCISAVPRHGGSLGLRHLLRRPDG